MSLVNHTQPIQLHYTCAGAGPDVLLIHGWASSGKMWQVMTDALQDRARFWAIDLAGFGASPSLPANPMLDINTHAALVMDFCDQHGIQPKAIVGHSMGGMLALKLALLRPELAEALVLLAPVVTGRFTLELNRLVSTDVGSFALARSKPFWWLAQSELLAPLLSVPAYVGVEAAERIRQDFIRATWQAATGALASIARENLEPDLRRIQQPTLVLIGAEDTTVPPQEGRLAAHRLQNARLLELPGVNHQPLDEQPDTVIAALGAFLAETGAALP
ncbi:MAG: alpha/beta hydrolase [Anaerolineaceae bacterium]|nr:alpha/beta hydrolase [Anaerolineaceae bacterium]